MEELNRENHEFINKFSLEKLGFFDISPLHIGGVGFRAKKNLKEVKGKISSLNIYIDEAEILHTNPLKKLIVSIYYGKESIAGVVIENENKFFDPINIVSMNDYSYNSLSGDFFRGNEKIESIQIVREIYDKHIKPTKIFRGFSIRNKLWFYRIFLSWVFKVASLLFSCLIFLISGNKFKYGFIEHINKRINIQKDISPKKPIDERKDKISFWGYKARPGCILSYSVLHFLVYVYLYFAEWKPDFVLTVFENTFLTLVYATMTLIIYDKILPKLFRKIVEKTYILSFNFSYGNMKV